MGFKMSIKKQDLTKIVLQEYHKLLNEKMLLDADEELLTDDEDSSEEHVDEAMTVGGGGMVGIQAPLGCDANDMQGSNATKIRKPKKKKKQFKINALSESYMSDLHIQIQNAVIDCILDCQEALEGLNDDNWEEYEDYDGSESHVSTVSEKVGAKLGISAQEVSYVINDMLENGDIVSDSSGYLQIN